VRAPPMRLAIGVVAHHHAGGIARQALRRSRGNVRAALEDRLARRIGVRQHRGIDVNHDLIPLTRRTRIDAPVQGRLGDERERVRLLLPERRSVESSARG